jgi:hypothetical protein
VSPTFVSVPRPLDQKRFLFLVEGREWINMWTRAAEDATRRLHLAQEAGDNDGGLIAAHEALAAVDRLFGWARSLANVCDDAYRARVEEFREGHPELRRARNLHEHRQGYVSDERDRQADERFTGAVAYRFTDDGSFRIELVTAASVENVDVALTSAIADSFVLAWETTKAVDRAIEALVREPGDEPLDVEYMHIRQGDDCRLYLSDTPPPGYDP